jgi:hypothetical protein
MSPPRLLVAPGDAFGSWTVVKMVLPVLGERSHAQCQCACGVRAIVRVSHLLAGTSRSCGCGRLRDLRGQCIGRLTLIERAPNVNVGHPRMPKGWTAWRCRCACGREIIETTQNLTRPRGPTSSCGCVHLKPAVAAGSSDARARSVSIDAPDVPAQRPPAQSGVDRLLGLAPLTAAERAAGVHVSQLGKTRRVVPVSEDDETETVKHDGDPWVW